MKTALPRHQTNVHHQKTSLLKSLLLLGRRMMSHLSAHSAWVLAGIVESANCRGGENTGQAEERLGRGSRGAGQTKEIVSNLLRWQSASRLHHWVHCAGACSRVTVFTMGLAPPDGDL